jgi:hypothetical protein
VTKKQVLAIGGSTVPRWVHSAFDVQHIGDEAGKGKIDVRGDPDIVVVNVDFVSHQYSGQAHEIGAARKIPVLHARGGWSSAVEEAAKQRLDWFVNAVGGIAQDKPEVAAEVSAVVDNAWEQAVADARARADAAEKRLAKERSWREELESNLKRLRSGAEDRIVSEIRRRAAELRLAADRRDDAVKEHVTKLVESTLAALGTAFAVQGELAKALRHVEETARGALAASDPSLTSEVESTTG